MGVCKIIKQEGTLDGAPLYLTFATIPAKADSHLRLEIVQRDKDGLYSWLLRDERGQFAYSSGRWQVAAEYAERDAKKILRANKGERVPRYFNPDALDREAVTDEQLALSLRELAVADPDKVGSILGDVEPKGLRKFARMVGEKVKTFDEHRHLAFNIVNGLVGAWQAVSEVVENK